MDTPKRETGRILVACMPKSGSTYVSKILSLYLEAPRADLISYWGRREQNIHPWSFERIGDGPFVVQMHILPHRPNLELLSDHRVTVVLLRRNLADALVSLDDHFLNEGIMSPSCYVDNPAEYAALPADARYRYLIRHALPWYISFHLSWREASASFPVIACRYEEMKRDAVRFFSGILGGMGLPVDDERLSATLARDQPGTRFNKGVIGRSGELFSRENKCLMAEMLRDHPQDLSDLIDELPWPLPAPKAGRRDQRRLWPPWQRLVLGKA